MSKSGLNLATTLRQPAELVAHGLAPASALADLETVAARARLYPLARRNLGGHPDRRRSLDAVAAAARAYHGGSRLDRSRQDHPDSYKGAGCGSRARRWRDDRCAAGYRRDDLGCTARQ